MWVTGGQQEGPDPAEAAALGVIVAEPEPLVFDLHPDAEEAIAWFFRVCTQWRVCDGQRIGLDYGAILGLFSLWRVVDPRALLEDLRVMEDAALAKIAELAA